MNKRSVLVVLMAAVVLVALASLVHMFRYEYTGDQQGRIDRITGKREMLCRSLQGRFVSVDECATQLLRVEQEEKERQEQLAAPRGEFRSTTPLICEAGRQFVEAERLKAVAKGQMFDAATAREDIRDVWRIVNSERCTNAQ